MRFVWDPYVLTCFWTDETPMPARRQHRLQELRASASPVRIRVLTPDTIPSLQRPGAPFHPAYPYLSAVHRADYLRAYLIHFHGGGYTDVKSYMPGSWVNAFREMDARPDILLSWRHPGGAMIGRPNTELTRRWYAEVCRRLDQHLPALMAYPGRPPPFTHSALDPAYPLRWTEIMGEVLTPLLAEYSTRVLGDSIPIFRVDNHR
jgi:hypothetical protein